MRWLEIVTHTSIMQSAVVGRTYAMYGRNRLNIREYSRTFANIREYSRIFANMFGQYSRILGPIFANIREYSVGFANVGEYWTTCLKLL